jgi:D-alanyl-lipoteichoic acid acyltransferase DltB (MBOAT superfamily)
MPVNMVSFYSDISFFGLAAIAIVIFRLVVKNAGEASRSFALVILSLSFLGLLHRPYWLGAMFAYCVLLAGVASVFYHRHKLLKGAYAIGTVISVTVFILFLLKYKYYFQLLFGNYVWLSGLNSFQWTGISYLTFRAIDLLVYSNSSRAKPFSFFSALAYLVFFPVFLSGPINRFGNFLEDQSAELKQITPQQLQAAILRIAIGVIKISLLAQVFLHYSIYSEFGKSISNESHVGLLGSLYATFLFIYLDFSGYSDVAIALGQLFGIRVPENFRFPFLSSSLQDFWNRWHITFAQFCRDYIFFLLLRQFKLHAGWIPNLAAQILAIAVTFFIMGAWHGSALNWIYYGIYHAFGMVVWLTFTKTLNQVAPEFYGRLKLALPYRIFSTWLTVTFVSVGSLLTIDILAARDLLHLAH